MNWATVKKHLPGKPQLPNATIYEFEIHTHFRFSYIEIKKLVQGSVTQWCGVAIAVGHLALIARRGGESHQLRRRIHAVVTINMLADGHDE